jgi:hypothetical protein
MIAALVLFASCSERITVSDLDALGLRYKVKSMDESFYLAYSSFDSIALHRKIYQHNYSFHHDCRYKSIEKTFYCGQSPDQVSVDSISDVPPAPDSITQQFPLAYKEPEYCLVNYRYAADSLATLEFFDRQGRLTSYVNRQYASSRLLSEEKYSGSGALISKSGYRYDSENRLTGKTIFFQNNYMETCYTHSAGEKLETCDELSHRYKFDINGRISSKKTYRGMTFLSEIRFHYNSHGETVMRQEISRDGTVMKTLYEYTYDAGNNWILCVEYNCTGNIFIRKRKITYYN